MTDKPTLPAESGWREIESAPRDGTHVLLLIDGIAQEGCYDGPSDGAIYSGQPSRYNWLSLATIRSEHDDDVTHWMPLPPPSSGERR